MNLKHDYVAERELVEPTLRLLAQRPDGYMHTSVLIRELEDMFEPTGHDASILMNRSDTHFSQKVRNMISHRESPSSFIFRGYADYTGDGLRITDMGRDYLRRLDAKNG